MLKPQRSLTNERTLSHCTGDATNADSYISLKLLNILLLKFSTVIAAQVVHDIIGSLNFLTNVLIRLMTLYRVIKIFHSTH